MSTISIAPLFASGFLFCTKISPLSRVSTALSPKNSPIFKSLVLFSRRTSIYLIGACRNSREKEIKRMSKSRTTRRIRHD
jgi:hypothetical protein